MDAKTICDICIRNGLPLQHMLMDEKYCGLEQGVGILEGKYRISSDVEDYNFVCTYFTKGKSHYKIFR